MSARTYPRVWFSCPRHGNICQAGQHGEDSGKGSDEPSGCALDCPQDGEARGLVVLQRGVLVAVVRYHAKLPADLATFVARAEARDHLSPDHARERVR